MFLVTLNIKNLIYACTDVVVTNFFDLAIVANIKLQQRQRNDIVMHANDFHLLANISVMHQKKLLAENVHVKNDKGEVDTKMI